MSQGHPQAWRYPLGFLWTEARIARERINQALATDAVIMHATLLAMWGGDKNGSFRNLIRSLQNGGE